MADMTHFEYEGNVSIKINNRKPIPEIEILSVENLIPINVKCKVNGVETVASAYMDYTSNTVHVHKDEVEVVGDADVFRQAILDFFNRRDEEESAEAARQDDLMAQEHYRLSQAQNAAYLATGYGHEDEDE